MKNISILGSTGSIGVNTLDIVSKFMDRFKVVSLAAGRNINLLKAQIMKFKPEIVSVIDELDAKELKKSIHNTKTEVVFGEEGLCYISTLPRVDIVVSAIAGSSGLMPTLAAIKAGKNVALANKETLVMAGKIIMGEAKKRGLIIFPVDSEHSAIFQSLVGHQKKDIRRIILTASGGPFYNYTYKELLTVTPEQALKHPNWQMGKKISVDSATLINKGLEMIEAKWLFDVSPQQIVIHIHPQSIVHSMVEYIDGSIVAQLSIPDMRGPIAYALSYPERLNLNLPVLNLLEIERLTFLKPDEEKFPSISLAYDAIKSGETMPIVLNAANEVVVESFIDGKTRFIEIPRIIKKTMDRHRIFKIDSIEDVLKVDRWARDTAKDIVKEITNDKNGKL